MCSAHAAWKLSFSWLRAVRRGLAPLLGLLAILLVGGCQDDPTPAPTPTAAPTPTPTPRPPAEVYSLSVSLGAGPFTAGVASPWSIRVSSDQRGDVTSQASTRLRVAPAAGVTVTATTVTFEQARDYTITAEAVIDGATLSETLERGVVAAAPAAIRLSLATATPAAGVPTNILSTLVDAFGNPSDVSATLTYTAEPPEGIDFDGDTLTATVAQRYTVTAESRALGVRGELPFDVVAGAPDGLDLSLSDDRLLPGDTLTATTTAADAFGNPLVVEATLSVEPSAGVRVTGPRILFTAEGAYTVIATWQSPNGPLTALAGPVIVDGTGPELVLTSPARGTFATEPQVRLVGQVRDALAGVDHLALDGVDISLAEDGSFDVGLPVGAGVTILDFQAFDLNGNRRQVVQSLIYGEDWAPMGERVTRGFYGRMGQETLDDLSILLEAELDPVEMNAWALSYNPIEAYYEVEKGPLGQEYVTSAYINIIELRYTQAVVTLTPHADGGAGYLGLEVVFEDLGLTVEAYGELYNVDYELCGEIDTVEGVATATARAAFDADGKSTATLADVNVTLPGFDMQMCDDSLQTLMSVIEEDTQAELETLLEDLINEDIPEELETLLDSLILHEPFEVEGTEMMLDAALESLTFDDRGANLSMWSSLTTTPFAGIPENPGVPLTISGPPVYDDAYSLYVSANDDLLNQLLYTMWAAGTLHLRYSAEELGLTPEQIALLFNGATVVEFALEPALPPVLLPTNTAGYLMDAALGDCFIGVWSDASTGDPAQLARDYHLAVTLVAPAAADAPTPNVLRVTFGEPTTLHLQVLESAAALPLSEDALNYVLDAASDELIGYLNGSLDEVPIPTIEDYTLLAYDFYMDGPRGDYLTIGGDLVPPAQ